MKAVQNRIKKTMIECKAAYKDKLQSLLNHDSKKAW